MGQVYLPFLFFFFFTMDLVGIMKPEVGAYSGIAVLPITIRGVTYHYNKKTVQLLTIL